MKTRVGHGRGNHPDIAFGVALIVIAAIALTEIRALGSGTASNMGGGYVPRALSLFLLVTGLFYAVRGFLLRPRVAIAAVGWKSLGLVVASIASFALTLETLGLFACDAGHDGVRLPREPGGPLGRNARFCGRDGGVHGGGVHRGAEARAPGLADIRGKLLIFSNYQAVEKPVSGRQPRRADFGKRSIRHSM